MLLIDVPFGFDACAIRRHCRNDETILLRGSIPVAFKALNGRNAPVALSISIQHISEPKRPEKHFRWRRDAVSYLRPIHLHVGQDGPPQTFDFMCQGEPATAALLRSLFSFSPEVTARREEFPQCWMFAGHPELDGVRYEGQRHTRMHPSGLMTS